MIRSTQTSVYPKSTGNLQFVLSVAGRHKIGGLWAPFSTSIRPLISRAMSLACTAQATGRLLPSCTLTSSGVMLAPAGESMPCSHLYIAVILLGCAGLLAT